MRGAVARQKLHVRFDGLTSSDYYLIWEPSEKMFILRLSVHLNIMICIWWALIYSHIVNICVYIYIYIYIMYISCFLANKSSLST